MICMACFKNPLRTLSDSIVATKDYSPSNLQTHLKTTHKDTPVYANYEAASEHRARGGGGSQEPAANGSVVQSRGTASLASSATGKLTSVYSRTKLPQMIIERGNRGCATLLHLTPTRLSFLPFWNTLSKTARSTKITSNI